MKNYHLIDEKNEKIKKIIPACVIVAENNPGMLYFWRSGWNNTPSTALCERFKIKLYILFSRMMQTIPSLNRSVRLNTPFEKNGPFFKFASFSLALKLKKWPFLKNDVITLGAAGAAPSVLAGRFSRIFVWKTNF